MTTVSYLAMQLARKNLRMCCSYGACNLVQLARPSPRHECSLVHYFASSSLTSRRIWWPALDHAPDLMVRPTLERFAGFRTPQMATYILCTIPYQQIVLAETSNGDETRVAGASPQHVQGQRRQAHQGSLFSLDFSLGHAASVQFQLQYPGGYIGKRSNGNDVPVTTAVFVDARDGVQRTGRSADELHLRRP